MWNCYELGGIIFILDHNFMNEIFSDKFFYEVGRLCYCIPTSLAPMELRLAVNRAKTCGNPWCSFLNFIIPVLSFILF